ncbi:hypothetical protein D3Z51_02230 [Clostridiaceae bacterium]|nr:hypothetical protein [Clostridiaceae bacterium]RKI18340.1 hypothetical protein D7V81_00360 [bacterium 1XD21-70]
MNGRMMRQRYAGVLAAVVLLLAVLPYFPPSKKAYGAVSFGGGEITYDEELVKLWDRLAAQDGTDLVRTDFIGHMTRTYPVPGIVVYKQQTSVSPSGRWKEYEYRNMYCISHGRELAENPNTTMETSAVWYIKREPYTLQNLPSFIKSNTASEYCQRLNFLIMAYAANYRSYQGTVNSDPVIGTSDYYLGQSFCTLSEEAKFTGDFVHDWEMYRRHATQIANRYNPSGLGSTQVYDEMMEDMEAFFSAVWNTARLAADCEECSDTGYLFRPAVALEGDSMYHARYPLNAETEKFFASASIVMHGDWNYKMSEGAIDFYSPSGQVEEEKGIAEINLENSNGIIRKRIGKESVREFHMPVKIGGRWSLTFAQGNLLANLEDGFRISVGSPKTGEPSGYPEWGNSSVARYKHTERWQADYVVNLKKMDAETGKPLENAWFDILEAFDDRQLAGSVLEDDNWDNDGGSQFLRWQGWDSPYKDNGDPDPCTKDQEVTDKDGWLVGADSPGAGQLQPSGVRAHRDIKYYSYTKGYCGGHPEPDPEDEDEAEEYERQIRICEELVLAGGFFHSLSGGSQELLSDRNRHYEEFVSLTYDYSARELAARPGYILHNQEHIHEPFENVFDGIHADTIPIETVTVHSSQYYTLAQDVPGKDAWQEAEEIEDFSDALAEDELVSRTVKMADKVSLWPKKGAGEEDAEKQLTEKENTEREDRTGEEEEAEEEKAEKAEETEETEKTEKTEKTGERETPEGTKREDSTETAKEAETEEGTEKKEEGKKAEKTAGREEGIGKAAVVASDSNADEITEEISLDDIWILDDDEDWEEYDEASPSNGRKACILPGIVRIAEKWLPENSESGSDKGENRFKNSYPIRNQAGFRPSGLAVIALADPDYTGLGGAGWTFRLYDYRTEGEIHINKRDLLLTKGADAGYDPYGDTQGDGTLEGAVYGLFAAGDLVHPDGKTGVVFQKGNLVAVAATDKNGDASFMAITEAPGTKYDYQLGKMVAGGFLGPENEYTRKDQKYSSNPYGNDRGRWHYPISDNQSANGNCWIGRPLLLGPYYVQELTRSEGYELSVYGIEADVSNRSSWIAGGEEKAVGTVLVEKAEGNVRFIEDSGKEEMVTEVHLLARGTSFGVDLYAKNIDPLSDPSFWLTKTGRKEVYRQWKEMETYCEPVEAVFGTQVIIEGESVEAKKGDIIELPCGDSVTVQNVEEAFLSPDKVFRTGNKGTIPTFNQQFVPELTGIESVEPEVFLKECNEALAEIGMELPGKDSPYFLIELGEDSMLWAQRIYDFLEREDCPAFNAASLEQIISRNGEDYAVLRYSFLKEGVVQDVVFSAPDQSFYVRYPLDNPENGLGHLYRKYPLTGLSGEDYEAGGSRYRWVRVPNEKPDIQGMDGYGELSEWPYVSAQEIRTYWVYGEGEFLRAQDGSIYQKEDVRDVERSGYQTVETVFYERAEARYDGQAGTWKIYLSPDKIPEGGEILMTVRYGNRFAGEGGSPSVTAAPSLNLSGSYIQPVMLAYPGQDIIYEDAGTGKAPLQVLERAVVQKIKVQKRIEDGRMGNFRFRAYLKSNLERLYRAEDGSVVWQDRRGQEQKAGEVTEENRRFPELVRKIYTKVLHSTSPLYADSRDAVRANGLLYGYEGDEIKKEANHGYTAILERTEKVAEDGGKVQKIKSYNYRKFFDAIAVANHDKWDDAAPSYTSWRPIGNEGNRREETLGNARVSDQVRQFAIDWYLEDEVKKLIRPAGGDGKEQEAGAGAVSYPDEIYDQALWEAVQKAENYLKPFFAYDLDEIYAVCWDGADGGNDNDRTTVSADFLEEDGGTGLYYGISSYLPYGTYVIVEQQPQYAGMEYGKNRNDFRNKHYRTDEPKEVVLPSVYDNANSPGASGIWSTYYNYNPSLSQEETERRYKIRFNQENHKILAHNHHGDFEIYKYGMDIGLIANGVPSAAGTGDYFALTQSEYRPYKNYYNEQDERTESRVDYYLSEGLPGHGEIAGRYRYSSVSEKGGVAGSMAMQGVQAAYGGKYASMLVPWSVTEPEGCGKADFNNQGYRVRLRLEKLDSETHENILHDSALFAVYAAKREDSEDGSGRVCFYEKDTAVCGTLGFLESMGAADIRPMARKMSLLDRMFGKDRGPGNLYTGVVSAGTPMCEESGRIMQEDGLNRQTGVWASYSTILDGLMREENYGHALVRQQQTAGYLEISQPLEAGAYVICEEKPPSGYVRSRPVALEIYSDKVTYYKEGDRDRRVAAAVYEEGSSKDTLAVTQTQSVKAAARVYVENPPIKLTVEKKKEASFRTANTTKDKTVTYKVSGRVDGRLVDIGNNPDYIYAYKNGQYLGYAWRKGTLEYLAARKKAGEQVEIAFDGEVFAGYGYVTRTLGTAGDENPYVAGARMALFESVVLEPSGDTQDHAYKGLMVIRNLANNVTRMYVKQKKGGKEQDILYYDLGNLEVTVKEKIDGRTLVMGYDRNHNKVPVGQAESEKANFERSDTEHSLFAFQAARPFLEFVGGDFTKLAYSAPDKRLMVDSKTRIYHLDRDGNRDCRIDPNTGMAYVPVPGDTGGRVMAWTVQIHKDEYGNTVARDKVTTSRPATVGENRNGYGEERVLSVTNHSGREIPEKNRPSYRHIESGFITGTWEAEGSEESHRETTLTTNRQGQNLNGEVLADDNNGSFAGKQNPVYDSFGLPVYYQKSKGRYDKGTEIYDRNGDFVRYQNSDNLEKYNGNAYRINGAGQLLDSQKILYHRQGEGYILENSWISSDRTPNDPFNFEESGGQPDILKRLPAGNYIMEELESPDGYLKGMPVGIIIRESTDMHYVSMVDKTTKIEIAKIDGTESHEFRILEQREDGTSWDRGKLTEKGGSYGRGLVPGAKVALFKAKKVYSPESPGGYYLEKTEDVPLEYEPTDSRAGNLQKVKAEWVTGTVPIYVEGIPAGTYLLEEIATPPGFVTSEPKEVEVGTVPEVQTFFLYNDHTKVEIEKYVREGREKIPLGGAKFLLYELDKNKTGKYQTGKDEELLCSPDQVVDCWVSSSKEEFYDFIEAFEAMYQDFGTEEGTTIQWEQGGTHHTARYIESSSLDASVSGGEKTCHPTSAVLMFGMEDGREIRIIVSGGNSFEYQFDYRKLPWINAYACSYTTLDGVRRIDYLPAGSRYVLREATPPKGYAKALDRVVEVSDTRDVQRFGVENQRGKLYISKEAEGVPGEFAGACMELYHAAEDGSFLPDQAYLEETWVSGSDDVYTDADYVNGKILPGYAAGDRKPHEIQGLEDGVYWLIEQKCPDYYTTMEPVKIEYQKQEEIRVVRAYNRPAEGRLEVKKTDTGGKLLEGAVYELKAYKKSDRRTPVLIKTVSDDGGIARVDHLPVGNVTEDGRIEPYEYSLREVLPPDGYAVNTRIFTWEFETGKGKSPYGPGEKAEKQITVTDSRTRVSIGKQDFDAMGGEKGHFLTGAKLALYEITGRDENGRILYDAESPYETWVTGQKRHTIEGLVAGRSYLLKELLAPEGYNQMEPLILTMSKDGRMLAGISSRLHMVTFHTNEETSYPDDIRIRSVTVRGRYPVRVRYELSDQMGTWLKSWTGSRDGYMLARKNGWEDGRVYTITEKTYYSDGSSDITGRRTEALYFGDDGFCHIPGREAEKVRIVLKDREGAEFASFLASEELQETTVYPEPGRLNEGENNLLTEYTIYSDKTCLESSRMQFGFHGEESISCVVAADKKTKVSLAKTDMSGKRNLSGCHMSLKDGNGKELAFWISEEEPYVLEGVLKPGETYQWEEEQPCEGYTRADAVWFTVLQNGAFQQVIMKDGDTKLLVHKMSGDGSKAPVEGAVLQILDQNRVPVAAIEDGDLFKKGEELVFVSGTEPTKVFGQLRAGENYLLHEVKPAPGYAYTEDVPFCMSEDGREDHIEIRNKKTRITVLKTDASSGEPLEGALLQIRDAKGRVAEQWVSGKESHEVSGKLEAGEKYFLQEQWAPEGYQKAPELEFQVPKEARQLTLVLENRKDEDKETPANPGGTKGDSPHPLPPKQEAPKKPGRITAVYDSGVPKGAGNLSDQLRGRVLNLALAGDRTRGRLYACLFFLSFLGAAFAFFAIRMTKQRRFAIINGIQTRKKAKKEKQDEKNSNRDIGTCGCRENDPVGTDPIPDRKDP